MTEQTPTPRFGFGESKAEGEQAEARPKLGRSASQNAPFLDKPLPRRDLSNINGKNEFLTLRGAAQAQQQRQAELELRVRTLQRQAEEAAEGRRAAEEHSRRLSAKLGLLEKEYRRQHDESEPSTGRQLSKLSLEGEQPGDTGRSFNPFLESEPAAAWLPAAQRKLDELLQALDAQPARPAPPADVPAPLRELLLDYQRAAAQSASIIAAQAELILRLRNHIADMQLSPLYADESSNKSLYSKLDESAHSQLLPEPHDAAAEGRRELRRNLPIDLRASAAPAPHPAAVLCQDEKLTEIAQKIKELYLHLQRRSAQLKFVNHLFDAWTRAAEYAGAGQPVPQLPRPSLEETRLCALVDVQQHRLQTLNSLLEQRVDHAAKTSENVALRRLFDALSAAGALDEGVRGQFDAELNRSREPLSRTRVAALTDHLLTTLRHRLAVEGSPLEGYRQTSRSLVSAEKQAQSFRARVREHFARLAKPLGGGSVALTPQEAQRTARRLGEEAARLRSCGESSEAVCRQTWAVSQQLAGLLRLVCAAFPAFSGEEARSYALTLQQLHKALQTADPSAAAEGRDHLFALETLSLALFSPLLLDAVRGR